jgi:hypothetical protein
LPDRVDDDAIVDALLWKLGFQPRTTEDLNERFWRRHDELVQSSRAATLSSVVDEEPIRQLAGLYFRDLEAMLDDCLCYATWAFTNDHYMSEQPFTFRPHVDCKAAMSLLCTTSSAASSSAAETISCDGRNTLYPLARGFAILAGLLEETQARASEYARDPKQFPRFVGKTILQKFPFTHTRPFLDLRVDAQMAVITGLKEMTKQLVSARVHEVRNDLVHFRRATANIDELVGALDAVRIALKRGDELGVVRTHYSHVSTLVDAWGRRTVTLASKGGQKVSFTRPSSFDWLALPPLGADQYLLHSAVFAEPNEVLRFRLGRESGYQELWSNYPRRCQQSNNAVGKQPDSGVALPRAAGHSESVAG